MEEMSSILSHYNHIFPKISFGNNVPVMDLVGNILRGITAYRMHKDDYFQLLVANYVREIWITESPPKDNINTQSIVDAIIESTDKPEQLDDRTWQKLKNLLDALNYIVVVGSSSSQEANIDMEKINELHSIIGHQLIVDAGNFRKKNVCATNSRVMYAPYKTIPFRLQGLLEFVNIKIAEIKENTDKAFLMQDMIRLGALFVSEFLLIHPFSNGNGRTASLLLTLFLKDVVNFPFSLHVVSRLRYIFALETRSNGSPPSDLAVHILLACNRTASQVNWLCATEQEKY